MSKIRNLIYIIIIFAILTSTSYLLLLGISSSGEEEGIEDLNWFFQNLTSEDRKKIRLAIDYAIARDLFIENKYRDYALSLRTPIAPYYKGIYDPTIPKREINSSKAKELMTEVFGKTFDNTYGVEDSDTITSSPYFIMRILSPVFSNRAIIPETPEILFIARPLSEIGIDVELKLWNWNTLFPRIFTDPRGIGFDYNHGGYDAVLMHWNMHLDLNYSDFYGEIMFPPRGNNIYWLENQEILEIWNQILKSTLNFNRIQALKDYQQWIVDNIPTSIIAQNLDPVALDPGISGLDKYYRGFYFQNITHPNQTKLVYAVSGNFSQFNPLYSTSYADKCAVLQCHGSLARLRGINNLTHPTGFLAESWNHSTDYLTWFVKLRKGVRWSDGTEVTADDVIFTYKSLINKSSDSEFHKKVKTIFKNENNIIKVDRNTVKFLTPEFNPFVEIQGFTVPIIQKDQMSKILLQNWKNDNTNRVTTPIGFGPFIFNPNFGNGSGFNGSAIELIVNPYYNGTVMGTDPNATGGGIYHQTPSMTNITLVSEFNETKAINGLKSGKYDILDGQIGINRAFLIEKENEKENETLWNKIISFPHWSWLELGYNHYSPIWGMNPHDPRIMYKQEITPVENIKILFLAIYSSISLLIIGVFIRRFGFGD